RSPASVRGWLDSVDPTTATDRGDDGLPTAPGEMIPAVAAPVLATTSSSSAALRSRPPPATDSSLAFWFAPCGDDATAVVSGPGSPHSASRCEETGLPPAAAESAAHPAGRSFVCALVGCRSSLHRPSTAR